MCEQKTTATHSKSLRLLIRLSIDYVKFSCEYDLIANSVPVLAASTKMQ